MRIPICLLAVLLALCCAAQAQTHKLRVGIFEKPPFAMKDASGTWGGLGVTVWEDISANLSLPFEYVEVTPEEAISETAAGRLDLVVGEIAVSPGRAKLVKFSQPYAVFPAAVALRKDRHFPHWLDFLNDVLQHGVLSILVAMLVGMLVFSLVLWLVERRVNEDHFGGHPIRGVGSALWFAAVTMTTVGYGDKTPKTTAGRVVVFFWMFIGVVAISVFTGTVASSIAVARIDTTISGLNSLARYRNGVAEGSITQNLLSETGIRARVYPTTADGLRALLSREITAFDGGEATLRYIVHQEFADQVTAQMIPNTHISYAFAMRPGLPLRDAIDVALINEVMQPGWRHKVDSLLGPAQY